MVEGVSETGGKAEATLAMEEQKARVGRVDLELDREAASARRKRCRRPARCSFAKERRRMRKFTDHARWTMCVTLLAMVE